MDFGRDIPAEQKGLYISNMRPMFNRRALFSDMTEDYVSPMEPNKYSHVTIRFRTEVDNVDRVYLIGQTDKTEKHLMIKDGSDELFDYYSVEVELGEDPFQYYFEIQAGKITCNYDTRGVTQDIQPHFMMRIIPGFKTPDWAKGAVIYQIYVDRFFNGDTSNDVLTGEYEYVGDKTVRVEDWNKYPASMGVREFYGGDLKGVLAKMDYLKDLGIDVIYFNPLFVSPSNHKYDIQDYDYIDPHFGAIVNDNGELLRSDQRENRFATRYINRVTNPENLEASNLVFAKVVEEAHKRGIRVILDGVFNHCGSFNKWMDRERIYENVPGYDKGGFVSADSPYRNYFQFTRQDGWPYNRN
ncbi:MAG: alpha amylase N-terminal ig-like domain-containing protein, partial [Lachnospiraceae bacterium]|nr:alpha amylase N-terminal ig-like domain-containing protein [Lachnospiraceae bacterium]